MADLVFKRGALEDLEDVSLGDGQLLFVTDQDKVQLYLDFDDGEDVVRKELKSGEEPVPITQAEYDALSSAEKNNGTMYLITDADAYYDTGGDMFKSIYDPNEDGVVTAAETANTVNGHTVNADVPSGAVFTDHTYSVMTGATASANGTSGLLPAPSAGDNNKFFSGDGTYKTVPIPVMTGATASANGTSGSIPAPLIADKDGYFKGDGTWETPIVEITQAEYDELTSEEKNNGTSYYITDAESYLEPVADMFKEIYDTDEDGKVDAAEQADNATTVNGHTVQSDVPAGAVFTDHTYNVMTGATSSAGGTAGLTPAPTTGDINKFLGGDGNWHYPVRDITEAEYNALSTAEKNNGVTYHITDSDYYSLDLISEINSLKARVTALEQTSATL